MLWDANVRVTKKLEIAHKLNDAMERTWMTDMMRQRGRAKRKGGREREKKSDNDATLMATHTEHR